MGEKRFCGEADWKIGDIVRCIQKSGSIHVRIGDEGEVTYVGTSCTRVLVPDYENDNRSHQVELFHKRWELVTKPKTKECDVKKAITDVFEKTQDALLVSKHLGHTVNDDFTGKLLLSTNKKAYLDEAQRLEAEEVAKRSK